MIANLKDKFLRRDAKFSLLMYERFFRILAGAKSMLAISPDNTYAISMMIFMMMEAVNLREIDELIEVGRSLDQGEGHASASAPNLNAQSSAPNFRSNSNQSASFASNSEPGGAAFAQSDQGSATSGVPSFTASAKRPASSAQNSGASGAVKQNLDAGGEIKPGAAAQAQNSNSSVKTGAQNEIYENFLAKIYDRDYDLGEKFSKCVEFLKFERGTLYLLSRAQGQDREYLRKGSRAINSVLKSLFGESAKIKIEQSAPQNGDDPAQSKRDRNSARGATATQSKNSTKGATSESGADTARPRNSTSQSHVNSASQNFTESSISSSVQENPESTQASEQSCAPQINSAADEAQAAKLQTDAARNSEQQNSKNSTIQNFAQRNSATNSNSQNSASNSKLQNSEISAGDDGGEKDDLLRSTDPQNYAAKPRDTSKSVRAAKAGLAELANGAQDGKEILISEINRLFGEPTKITE